MAHYSRPLEAGNDLWRNGALDLVGSARAGSAGHPPARVESMGESRSSLARRADNPSSEHPEVRFVTTLRTRMGGMLDQALDDPPPDPSLDEVLDLARPWVGRSTHGWWIAGGEPMLRPDLPELVSRLSKLGAQRLGLITDGLALAAPGVAERLAALGVQRVRVPLHSARMDANDWLAGAPGAGRRVVKAIQACRAARITVGVEVVVTRPTMDHLGELVELLGRLGVAELDIRPITARGPAEPHYVTLAPRVGLLQPMLESAVSEAVRRGMKVRVHGFSRCTAPGVAPYRVVEGGVTWELVRRAPWSFLGPHLAPPPATRGCATCPGSPECAGAPSDYARRFGLLEFLSEDNRWVNPAGIVPPALEGGLVEPPARAGRFPPTRVSYPRRWAARPTLGGDPLAGVAARQAPEVIRVIFVAPGRVKPTFLGDAQPAEAETTRAVRIRLVRASQHGVRRLRIASASSLAHPDAGELLREAARLGFPEVEVAGEASALDDMSDMALRRLRGITRLDVALYGPDAERHDAVMGRPGAFDAAMRAFDRISALVPSIELGCYGILTDASSLEAFAEAWEMGDLPGAPAFRLASKGGSLVELAEAARRLKYGPAADAIASVLPSCLFEREGVHAADEADEAWGELTADLAAPSGSDRIGCYTRCLVVSGCSRPACPGLAVGWSAEGVPPVSSNGEN